MHLETYGVTEGVGVSHLSANLPVKARPHYKGDEMSDTRTYIPWQLGQDFITAAFRAVGVPEEDARICTDVILESDRRGIDSHGCNRFKPMYMNLLMSGVQKPVTQLEILKETPATLVVDAHQGLGMVAAVKTMRQVIGKAKNTGIAMGVVKNSGHFGIAGYYAMMAAKEDLLGICGTNTRPSVAPTFGVQNILGTNPFTFAFPTDEAFPFVLDCATCVCSKGKIETYARKGERIPDGVVIGADGNTITDSREVMKEFFTKREGAILPLGGAGEEHSGYKGYGYATVVEILSAALSAGDFLTALSGVDGAGHRVLQRVGHFFLVIDPDAFFGKAAFKETTGKILRELRASRKAPGHDRIYTAGEKEYYIWQERKKKGIPLLPGVPEEFIEVRDRLHLPYIFPFEI